MTHLLTVDPGLSSGIALGYYSATEPYRLVRYWQVLGGLQGFLDWRKEHYLDHLGPAWDWNFGDGPIYPLEIAAERFVLLNNKFTLRGDALEPLRIEGAMVALGMMPANYDDARWQRAGMQYFMCAPEDEHKKSTAAKWLTDKGFRVTGKNVGLKDADDVRSAILHGIAHLRAAKHMPTLLMISPPPQ